MAASRAAGSIDDLLELLGKQFADEFAESTGKPLREAVESWFKKNPGKDLVVRTTGPDGVVKEVVLKAADAVQLPAGFDPTKGFSSFDDFKSVFGEAGPGQAWHHIVEQTINSGRFAQELLHNPANLISLPHGKGSIHAKISGYYSSKQPFTNGMTVREWLSTKSFKEQFEFGVQTIKNFGGTQYLPPHLR